MPTTHPALQALQEERDKAHRRVQELEAAMEAVRSCLGLAAPQATHNPIQALLPVATATAEATADEPPTTLSLCWRLLWWLSSVSGAESWVCSWRTVEEFAGVKAPIYGRPSEAKARAKYDKTTSALRRLKSQGYLTRTGTRARPYYRLTESGSQKLQSIKRRGQE